MTSTLVLLKPDIVGHPILLQTVVNELCLAGLSISAARRIHLSLDEASRLYAAHKGRFFYPRLVRHVSSGPVIALKVFGDARSVLGSSKLWPLPETDKSLRQQLAISDVRNVAHNSDPENAQGELDFFAPLLDVQDGSLLDIKEIFPLKHPESVNNPKGA